MTVAQPHSCWLIYRYREQAPFHIEGAKFS